MSTHDSADDSRWFLGGAARRPGRIGLVCLPHAGGAASAYRTWLAGLGEHLNILPVQLPGRENRISTPFAEDLDTLVADLTRVVLRREPGEIALFGHSMGAVIATRLCAALEQRGRPVRHLFVSGHFGTGPWPSDERLVVPPTAHDEVLVRSVSVLDPAAAALFEHPELRALMLPVLRSDLRLMHGASLTGLRVDAPVTALAGTDDPVVRDLGGWAGLSRTDSAVYRLPGSHFYLAEQGELLGRIIRERLGLTEATVIGPDPAR
jgi:pyochelin biosynthetic protein PchC